MMALSLVFGMLVGAIILLAAYVLWRAFSLYHAVKELRRIGEQFGVPPAEEEPKHSEEE